MLLPAADAYRLWAPTYDLTLNPVLALETRIVSALLRSFRLSSVIDVACGTGRWLMHFEKSGIPVVGVDACEEMLLEARRRLSACTRLVLADAQSLPLRESSADLVLCSMALGYFGDLQKVFMELVRVAARGGCVAVSDLHPDALAAGWTRSFRIGSDRYEIEHCCHSFAEIESAALCAGLRKISLHSAYFDIPEWPVFQSAGKEELFKTVRAIPALFLYAWEKPCY